MNFYILLGIVLVILVVISFMYYMGFFYTPKAVVKCVDEMHIVNMNFQGPFRYYNNAVNLFMTQYKECFGEYPNKATTGSIYYDMVTPDCDKMTLRWSVFAVISPDQYEKYQQQVGLDLRIYTLPQSHIALTSFPMRNVFSYGIGSRKAYPVLNELLKQNNFKQYGCVELYNCSGVPIKYIFYIDECEVFNDALNDTPCIQVSTL
ncbi:hypothetical protein WA158_001314 [Blastocystis sp. Blastoise]